MSFCRISELINVDFPELIVATTLTSNSLFFAFSKSLVTFDDFKASKGTF